MRKTKEFLAGHCGFKFVVVTIFTFMFLFTSSFFNTPLVFAQDQEKEIYYSMRTDQETLDGVVIGTEHKATNTLSWKGIPYAKPPVDNLRWKAPQEPQKRSQPLKTVDFCEICPQYTDHDNNPATPPVIRGNEDCLYLNIWRPKTKADNLPVYFWIHGGGNSIQWPLLSYTDGAVLANKANLVVVTVNYRLGPMGFFSHPALRSGKKGDEKTDSGNFALLDLIQALSWVNTNIKAFGGNPENVTIAGQSAGAQNILSLIASPLAKDLFQQAISESALVKPTTPARGAEHFNNIIAKLLVKDGLAKDEKTAATKLKGMSLKDIEKYLRSKSAKAFLEMYAGGAFAGTGMIDFPTSFGDGTVLPVDFYGALKAGHYNKVPIILGSNKEETKIFLLGDPKFTPWRNDGSLFADQAKNEMYNLVAQYQSDGWKVRGVDEIARILKSNTDQPAVYAYHFLWGAGGKNSVIPFPYDLLMGACHTMEIDFVFGTEAVAVGGYAFDEKNRSGRVALTNAMMDYWSQFARMGNPNRDGSGLPEWKQWSNAEGASKIILLDADLNNLKIEMSGKELTNEAFEKILKAEPRQKEIQPFWDAFRQEVLN